MGMMSGGLSMIGGFIQAAGAQQQAEAEAKAHEYNAAVAVRNRKVIQDTTLAAVWSKGEANARTLSTIRGQYAAAGVQMTGSALDVTRDTAQEQSLDLERIEYQGSLMAIEQTDTENLETMAATAARKAGSISAAAAIIGGLSGALGSMN